MKKRYVFIVVILIISSALLIYFKNSNNLDIEQFKKPKQGEEVAIINTNYGDIKIRLFDEIAPKVSIAYIIDH